jgi:predicted transcriptional regulator
MAFTLRTDSVAGLDDWLDAEAEARHTSKQAITLAALQEYRERREFTHVLALGARTAVRHRVVLDRLADA